MPILSRLLPVALPLLLLALAAIAGYVYFRVKHLSIPIPLPLTLFAFVLPIITYLTTRTQLPLLRAGTTISLPLVAVFTFQLLYETIIATLSLTYMVPPSSLHCGLEDRWRELYKRKDGRAIQAIQDAFNCCGFNSVWDRAWPFKNNAREGGNCAEYFHRNDSCRGKWRQAEQVNAGLLLLIAVVLFIVKVLSMTWILTNRSGAPRWTRHLKWHSHSNGASEEDRRASRRLIGDNSNVVGEEYYNDPESAAQNRPLIEPRGNEEEEGERVEPSQLAENGSEWREE